MMPLGRIGALLLGLALALAWSSAASAARPKEKKKRTAPSASVSHSSRGGGSHASTKSQPSRTTPSKPRASSGSNGGRAGSSTGLHRPSSSSRSADPGSVGERSRSGSRAVTPQPAPSDRGLADPTRRKRGVRTPDEAGPPAPRTGRDVPPTVSRGGKTFTQRVVAEGEAVVVRRASPDLQAPAPQGAQSHTQATHHHGHHDHYYHHHTWGHAHYYCYVHYWFYAPWFWGFYFAPFPTPWYYTWAWYGAPWYVAWGWYYTPYPYYAAPSYWVTDYVVSSMLEDEYLRGYSAGYADGRQAEGTPIAEPVKEQLRQQVDETAKAFQTEQAIALETALENPDYLFVVDTPISVATKGNDTCGLSGGDIIKPVGAVDPAVPVASMSVVTSKNDSCAAGSVVSVSFTDLQEMLNTFGERVDDGLNELQQQGQVQQREGAGR